MGGDRRAWNDLATQLGAASSARQAGPPGPGFRCAHATEASPLKDDAFSQENVIAYCERMGERYYGTA